MIFVSNVVEMPPWLHHVLEFEIVIDWLNNEDSCFDTFEMIIKTNEPPRSWWIWNCRCSRSTKFDAKDISCLFRWLGKHESLFPTIVFMTQIFFRIVGSQIEIENFFSLVKILKNLRRCTLQTYILDKLIFLIKNWPNDPKVGCYLLFNLIELIETNVSL